MPLEALIPALLAAGCVTGVLAGLFGVGGGLVTVPVLFELFGLIGVPLDLRQQLCLGTSFGVMVPTSIRSFRRHRASGQVDMPVLKGWAVPVVVGVGFGAVAAALVSAKALLLIFAAVLLFSAARTFMAKPAPADSTAALPQPGPPVLIGSGFGIGFLSSLMGIGGGLFGNMLLMGPWRRSVRQAVATSSGLGVLIAIPATIGFVIAGLLRAVALPYSFGFVSWLGVLAVAPTSVLLAPLGVRLAHKWPQRRLALAFAIFQLVIAARYVAALTL